MCLNRSSATNITNDKIPHGEKSHDDDDVALPNTTAQYSHMPLIMGYAPITVDSAMTI